ncbi:MAG: hypothetical protein JHC26_11535 [Thermofilum sp.]|jgi:hypothetical protein|uniref:hypothetical protein n=1 Tax=Thermofilum sp. TaxID=1961369 RepID=UPI00258E35D3|nr:hypothetical protein [Thermofilum sp.]MCI4409714.1 hypothetical protein [Thermofilum sp.]
MEDVGVEALDKAVSEAVENIQLPATDTYMLGIIFERLSKECGKIEYTRLYRPCGDNIVVSEYPLVFKQCVDEMDVLLCNDKQLFMYLKYDALKFVDVYTGKSVSIVFNIRSSSLKQDGIKNSIPTERFKNPDQAGNPIF